MPWNIEVEQFGAFFFWGGGRGGGEGGALKSWRMAFWDLGMYASALEFDGFRPR